MRFVLACGLALVGLGCGTDTLGDAAQALDQRTLAARRQEMVETQIRARGVDDERVLAAMARVPRHRFVLEADLDAAYEDHPIAIGFGQTISQPYIVGFMSDALALDTTHRVLEIGTGSGYQAAVLGELAREVYTIEIVPELAARSTALLKALGYANVHVRTGDGYAWTRRPSFP